MKKVGLWIALFLCIKLLAGCTKDEVIDRYNEILQKAGAEEPVALLNETGTCFKTLTLPGAGGYLVVEGKDFSGRLEIEAE